MHCGTQLASKLMLLVLSQSYLSEILVRTRFFRLPHSDSNDMTLSNEFAIKEEVTSSKFLSFFPDFIQKSSPVKAVTLLESSAILW